MPLIDRSTLMHVPPPSREMERLRLALADYGLDQHLDSVSRLMRPGMELIAEGQADGPGCSRFGGEPDLPSHMTWPCSEDVALTFIAQISLEDVRSAFMAAGWKVPEDACDPEGLLPVDGLLQFYCMWEGHEASPSEGDARVVHIRRGELLKRAVTPSTVRQPLHRLTESGIRFNPKWDFPCHDDPASNDLPDSEEKWDDESWMVVWEAMESQRSKVEDTHRFLGYAQEIQGSQQFQCAQMALMDNMGLRRKRTMREVMSSFLRAMIGRPMPPPIPMDRLEKERANWRILLQLTSDSRIGSEWGDAGSNYFWMTEQDLRGRRFENACWIAECY